MNKCPVSDAVRHVSQAVGFLFAISVAAATASAAPCPRTSQQLNMWVHQSINALVRSAYAAYVNDAAQTRHQRTVDGIATMIQRCRLNEDAKFAQRYPQLLDYVRLLSIAGKDDHELGFEVSDRDYFAETGQYTTIPDFLLTPVFLRAVSSWENLSNAKALLSGMNKTRAPNNQLLFFSYASRHLGTPDNPDSYRRLLIVVPGDRDRGVPEKWVQFGIADPRRPRTVRNVSVVSVMRGEEDATNVFFKDFFRTYRRNGSIAIKGRWELGEGDDPCVTCHKSGVLPIFPVAGTVSTEDKPVLDAVNERFRSYGVARFGRYIDTARFGPGLGSTPPNSLSRNASFTVVDRFNTRACTSCHNPNGLGALNWPMDSTLIESFVTGGQMPLNAHLPRAARIQLYKQLVGEYFAVDEMRPGILQAWLLGKMRPAESEEIELTKP